MSQWNKIPGINENQDIDCEFLLKWLEECENILNNDEMNYLYYKIGFMLGKFEKNENNLPCGEICDLIELFDNNQINNGFLVGINPMRNFIGTVMFAGNNFERELSRIWGDFAEENVDKYPVICKLLKYLSKEYKQKAHENEIDDEMNDLEYD